MIKYLSDIYCKILESKTKINIEVVNILMQDILYAINYLRVYNYIFIPILGDSSTGKSTIINGIIGENILPTDQNECTKKGIIIRYCDNTDEQMTISKANFVEKKVLNKTFYYFERKNIIGKGIKQVTETLKGVNFYYSDEDKDSFYYIRTKIKLFDDLQLDNNLKSMIYLIDFPGFGTDNRFVSNEIYKKVLSFCNSFLYVFKNSVIKEENTQKNLYSIFNQIKNDKNKLPSGIIRSYMFIMNNFNSQSINENDIAKARKDIKYILDNEDDNINNNAINLCSINAQFYSDYLSLYNYFNNVENSLEYEFNRYLTEKYNVFKFPELVEDYNYNNSFCEYLDEELDNIIRDQLRLKTNDYKSQQINENSKKSLTNILYQFKDLNFVEMKDILLYENKISQKISFGIENIDKVNLLKDSNIEGFRRQFLSQINYVNSETKREINKRIQYILQTLDNFFDSNFSQKKNEPKEIENFTIAIVTKKDKLRELLDNNELKIQEIINKFIKNTIQSLINKKSTIKELLKTNNFKKILEVISDECKNSIKELYDNIVAIINNIDLNSSKIMEETLKLIDEFSEEKKQVTITGFKQYLLEKIGDINKDLYSQLYKEISRFSMNKIFSNKGFINWFKSAFYDYHYLINNIDIIIEVVVLNIDSNLSNIIYYLTRYIKKMLRYISKRYILATNKFSKEQLEIWEEIGKYYKFLRGSIMYAKCKLCKNDE